MPRPTRTPKMPIVLGGFYYGIQRYEIFAIDEETESYGKGANKRLGYLKNFDKAVQEIVEKYLNGDQKIKSKLKLTVSNPKKLKPLMEQLEFIGIELNERALRNLAKIIRKEIIVWENAIKNNLSKGTF
jgi:hypothetical protein